MGTTGRTVSQYLTSPSHVPALWGQKWVLSCCTWMEQEKWQVVIWGFGFCDNRHEGLLVLSGWLCLFQLMQSMAEELYYCCLHGSAVLMHVLRGE